jgi:alcohol dehydrogenase class IV
MSPYLHPIDIIRPNQVTFGSGTVSQVGAWVAARGFTSALIVADAFNAARTHLLELRCSMSVFGEVRQEPDIANLTALLEVAASARADVVIGFGGGSAMDLAKLAAVLPGSGQTLQEIVGPEKVNGVGRIALVQVPTTAGTGSEAGTRALVTDPVTQNKLAVQSLHMLADLAVVDPDLTLSVPPHVTAATGVDAMAHCVEAYTNKRCHPMIDLYALEGVRLVGHYLPRAVSNGGDREARAALALASLYGGYCLGPVNTAAGHAVAYPLGTRHHIAHGAANALVFPHVLAFNFPAVPEKTRAIMTALAAGSAADSGERVFDAAYQFCAGLGVEMRLSNLGVPRADLPAMAADAHAIRRLMDNNPRDLSRDDILRIYEAAY